MKKIACLLLALFTLCSLVSCQKSEYRTDLNAIELTDELVTLLFSGVSLQSLDNEVAFFEGYTALPDGISEFSIRRSSVSTELDEFGVFRCKNEAIAKETAAALQTYLTSSFEEKKDWLDSYSSSETPKLKNAKVKTLGTYVAYGILEDSQRTAFFDTLHHKLER